MIWNDQLLFLHVPKTGGMSISERLLERLPRPVYCSVPPGHVAGPADVRVVPGIRHESLAEARDMLARRGIELASFQKILVTIRNPYALEVSRYFYLRQDNPQDRGADSALAAEGDFEAFVERSTFHGRERAELERWMLLDGKHPENLAILRTERLEADLKAVLDGLGLGELAVGLPHINATAHGDFRTYLTPRAEAAIHRRYAWVFEAGLYPRLDLGSV